jgi:hypothetical protein
MVPFQNCVRQRHFVSKMAAITKNWNFCHLKKFQFLVMAAILDTGRRWRTQFWKGTTQGSSQQSLVEIGSVVSEEKIFFLISSPLFSNLHNRSKSAKVQSS